MTSVWRCGPVPLSLGERTLVMGVLNVTPDSFSDGGEFATLEAAVAQGRRLVAEGADVLDVGGESTRPGAAPVDVEEEKRRVLPVIEALAKTVPVPLSIDTSKAEVAEAAVLAGAIIVNDVSGGTYDPRILRVAARHRAGLVLMHVQGRPETMQRAPAYADVVREVREHLAERARAAGAAGVRRDAIVLDPGIGFGKSLDHNLALVRGIPDLKALGFPVLVGLSRKSFLGHLSGAPDPKDRVEATVAANVLAVAGGADVVRVHDVREVRRGLAIADALHRGWRP